MKRILIFIIATLSFLETVHAQRLIVNGYKYATPPAGGPPTTNLWAYYEADQGVTGSPVSQWNDLSGNGRHLTQATSGNRPTISSNIITFNNTSPQWLQRTGITLSGAYTIYIVASVANVSSDCYLYIDKAVLSSPQHAFTISGSNLTVTSNGSNTVTTAAPANNTYALLRGTFNGASSAAQVNNSTAGTGNAGSGTQQGNIFIGLDFALGLSTMSVKAVYIYTQGTDVTALKTYTTTKWGLP